MLRRSHDKRRCCSNANMRKCIVHSTAQFCQHSDTIQKTASSVANSMSTATGARIFRMASTVRFTRSDRRLWRARDPLWTPHRRRAFESPRRSSEYQRFRSKSAFTTSRRWYRRRLERRGSRNQPMLLIWRAGMLRHVNMIMIHVRVMSPHHAGNPSARRAVTRMLHSLLARYEYRLVWPQ